MGTFKNKFEIKGYVLLALTKGPCGINRIDEHKRIGVTIVNTCDRDTLGLVWGLGLAATAIMSSIGVRLTAVPK